MTRTSTVALMENTADGHDEAVLEWQDDLLLRVPSPDPMARVTIFYERFDG